MLRLKASSIKGRLILFLLAGLIPVFLILTYLGSRYTRDALYKNALTRAKTLALKAARDIEYFSLKVSRKPHGIAILAGLKPLPLHRIENLMKHWVETEGAIYGMALAYIPGYGPGKGPFCTYYYVSSQGIRHKYLVPPDYDYTRFQWFYQPLKEKKSLWSEPYFDKGGGGIWMSTYSVPVTDSRGKVIGIATADISLTLLSRVVGNIRFLKEGRAFLLSHRGHFLAHPPGRDTSPLLKKLLRHQKDPALAHLMKSMTSGERGYQEITLENRGYLVYYTPVRSTNWSIGVIFPKDRLFEPLQQLRIYSASVDVVGVSLIVFLVLWISSSVTKDVIKIKEVSTKIAQGKFDVPIPPGLGDEAREIARALEAMQASLKEYVTRAKEAAILENELELAVKIQSFFVPQRLHFTFENLEITAQSKAARQVGGDFYGIKELSSHRLLLYLGDVSGKGIPAALYVAVVRSIMEVLAHTLSSPQEIMKSLNKYMARLTRQNNFATMFLVLIDPSQGEMRYCNAGHIPPLIHTRGTIASLPATGNVPIGLFQDYSYTERIFYLEDMEGMFVFSDGITESMNGDKEFFGGIRLVKVLQECFPLDSETILKKVLEAQEAFRGDTELHDDTTIISLKKRPLPST